MKLTNALCVIILAATASAVALPKAEPICGKVGQPCKREADANPLPYAEAICGKVGQPCRRVKRAAEALAEALAEPIAEPEDAILLARCNLVGGACYEAKRMTRDLAEVVAVAARNPEAYYDGLNLETGEGMFISVPLL